MQYVNFAEDIRVAQTIEKKVVINRRYFDKIVRLIFIFKIDKKNTGNLLPNICCYIENFKC